LELKQITQRYDGRRVVYAIQGVSLRIETGEMVGIMGPSGCGKSTLLNIIGGLMSPTHGSVLIEGVDITSLDDDGRTRMRREKIGFIFQFFNLLPTLTAAENVALPLHLLGIPAREVRERVAGMLGLVGLAQREAHLPDELSGGEQQRVAIARALATRPSVILADEPTGNLDSANGVEVLALLKNLSRHFDNTVILVTHDPRAAGMCDRIVEMRDGRLGSRQEETRDAPAVPAYQHS
jgi:putative ABC transport system ATP-binding protein